MPGTLQVACDQRISMYEWNVGGRTWTQIFLTPRLGLLSVYYSRLPLEAVVSTFQSLSIFSMASFFLCEIRLVLFLFWLIDPKWGKHSVLWISQLSRIIIPEVSRSSNFSVLLSYKFWAVWGRCLWTQACSNFDKCLHWLRTVGVVFSGGWHLPGTLES